MIDIQHDLRDLERALNPAALIKAQRSALTSIRNKARTQASKSARKIYNVSARAIADRVRVSTNDNNTALIRYVGTRIGLINFGAKFKRVKTKRGYRQGATVRVRKDQGRQIVKRGFIAAGNNNNIHIFQRVKAGQKSRLPIRALKGPSIPQMVQQGEVIADVDSLVSKEYPEMLLKKMEYFFDRQFK